MNNCPTCGGTDLTTSEHIETDTVFGKTFQYNEIRYYCHTCTEMWINMGDYDLVRNNLIDSVYESLEVNWDLLKYYGLYYSSVYKRNDPAQRCERELILALHYGFKDIEARMLLGIKK